MLKTNEKAPYFSLYSSDKEKISLDSIHDEYLLILFYPLAFSSVCTSELSEVNEDLEIYKELHCNVIAVSSDSVFVLEQFKEHLDLKFDLLSDYNRDMSRSYQVLHQEFVYEMREVPKRAAFIINKKGIIKYVEVLDNPGDKPDFDAIKSTLRKLNKVKRA